MEKRFYLKRRKKIFFLAMFKIVSNDQKGEPQLHREMQHHSLERIDIN